MITQPIHRQQTLPAVREPLTASQALAIAYPAAVHYDPQARWVRVASGDYISDEGLSNQWSFRFDLPQQRAEAIVRVAADPAGSPQPVLCRELVHPFPEPESQLAAWLEQGAVSQDFVNEHWQWRLDNHPALPIPFSDSPDAVRALREQGVNFISGDDEMVLSGEVLPDGQAVWRIIEYGVEYQTPFARPESGDRQTRVA
jgi:hypothetical protein